MIKKKEKCKIQSEKSKIAYLAKTDNSLEAAYPVFTQSLKPSHANAVQVQAGLRFQSFHNGRHTIFPPPTILAIAD